MGLFGREVKWLGVDARLPHHPNIASILHHFIDYQREEKDAVEVIPGMDDAELLAPRTLFMLMPLHRFCLRDLIEYRIHRQDGTGVLREIEAVHIGLGVARALYHIHQHQLVHRDLKPDNILLDMSRAVPDSLLNESHLNDPVAICASVPILTDFGECLETLTLEADQDLQGGGNPEAVPPEIRAALALGPGQSRLNYSRYDSWGLGLLLYAMLSREAPFMAPDQLSELRGLPETVSHHMRRLVRWLLSVKARDRATLEQAVEELRQMASVCQNIGVCVQCEHIH
eukprot:TRINITY_DN17710_c0_g1_i1.p1 TRINITY_DN17710_c0_g1~~TRINITY_DN17710_c0_g1_i1.p1  ORF type:complete len:285 (-),score=49.41 TRINITY_DN17710_c0_g1_i1:69-923(-)